jgi:cytochrome P450
MSAAARVIEAPRVPGLPLLGALAHLTWQGMDFFVRAWKRHGDFFRIRMGPRDVLCMVHPDAVEHVLVTRRENYVKGMTYRQLRVLTGDGLVTLEGEVWRKRRRIAQPAFHKESIRALVATMARVTGDVLAALRAQHPRGATVDAYPEMLKLTLDIVGETLFGERLGDRSNASARAFTHALEVLSNRGNMPIVIPLAIPTPGNVRLKRALATVDELVFSIIRRARAAGKQPTLMSMLIESRDVETGDALADAELRNEVITLVFAGHETTALLMTWGFTLLGDRPDVVERMRAEVRAVLGDRAPTAEDLPRLVYVRQVIDEILRLRSPVWALGRDVVADDSIGGVRVHAGETVLPLTYLTHRHPEFWDAPDVFDPDRFAPERPRPKSFAYYPFSVGPRTCIGNIFALSEAQVIFAMLLQRADFRLVSRAPVPMRLLMTLRPGAPVPVALTWR